MEAGLKARVCAGRRARGSMPVAARSEATLAGVAAERLPSAQQAAVDDTRTAPAAGRRIITVFVPRSGPPGGAPDACAHRL